MKLSVVIPVLDSHEIVRRQILWLSKLNRQDTEIILMDDGSKPPLPPSEISGIMVVPTRDFRPWTQEKARNMGARIASGKNLLMVDVDHILTQEAIDAARAFTGDRMEFKRRFGILDEEGNLDYSKEIIKSWGVRLKWRGITYIPGHRNTFCMPRALFWEWGGYDERLLVGRAYPYGGGPDSRFYRLFRKARDRGEVILHPEKPEIFFFPQGKYCGSMDTNPFGLFHTLSRKSGQFRSKTEESVCVT